jgi:leader peptidase (prepilin peptidase) / N-methyltransferase
MPAEYNFIMSILTYLEASLPLFIAAMAVLGLIVGSFLNVVIHRLPKIMEQEWRVQCRQLLDLPAVESDTVRLSLVHPRSRCPHCGHQIRWYENIPIVSYLSLRGACSGCGAGISLRYPVIELAAAILAAITAWHFGFGLHALAAVILSWALLTLSMIDLDTRYLPDDITLPFLWLGLGLNMLGLFATLHSAVLGAILGYGIFWVVFQIFRIITGKEGMGFGDFKLLAMLGAWLGWQALPLIIVLASFIGAAVGIGMIFLRSRDRHEPIPFGPYLAGAGWVALLWGAEINAAYLNWALP